MEILESRLKDGEFATSDLYYAAFLKTAKVSFSHTLRLNKRVYFVFENTPTLSDLKKQYWNRSAKVCALTYADEIKAMKSLTHTTA